MKKETLIKKLNKRIAEAMERKSHYTNCNSWNKRELIFLISKLKETRIDVEKLDVK